MMTLLNLLRTGRDGTSRVGTARRRRLTPSIEAMEARVVLSTFAVTNLNDSGAGSLRQAILSADADNDPTGATINVSSGLARSTVTPRTALPNLTNLVGITLNGPTGGALTVNLTNSGVSNPNGGNNGLRVVAGVTATISNMNFNNAGGRGVENEGVLTLNNVGISYSGNGGAVNFGAMSVQNSTIFNNRALNYGGGIDNSGGSLEVDNSAIFGNTARQGGGIDNYNGALNVIGSSFFWNSCSMTNGQGGAIYTTSGGRSVGTTIRGSTFTGNSAATGGAIDIDGATTEVSGCNLTSNSAAYGGAIAVEAGEVAIDYDQFQYNIATVDGGAVHFVGSNQGKDSFMNDTSKSNNAPNNANYIPFATTAPTGGGGGGSGSGRGKVF